MILRQPNFSTINKGLKLGHTRGTVEVTVRCFATNKGSGEKSEIRISKLESPRRGHPIKKSNDQNSKKIKR
ncbi:MAG: hypothetical protein QG657_2528 [Acidobacteriota bacterium]|nr:hypothetical protein [Acidobacteriota bacterium]